MSREEETGRDDEELKGTLVMGHLFVFLFGKFCLKQNKKRPAGMEEVEES